MNIADSLRGGSPVARRRRIVLIAASAIVIGGFAFGWSWVVAVGVASLLLSVLPCVAMCAVGICMMRSGNQASVDGTNGTPSSHWDRRLS